MSKDFDYENDDFEMDYDFEDEFEDYEIYDDLEDMDYDYDDEDDYDSFYDYDELEDFREIVLTLDDGSELNAVVVSQFDLDGTDYIALLPVDEVEHKGILLYRAVYSDDYETFEVEMIEDEEEFELASEAYYENVGFDLDDYFEFEDGHYHDHDCGCGDDDCECGGHGCCNHDHEE